MIGFTRRRVGRRQAEARHPTSIPTATNLSPCSEGRLQPDGVSPATHPLTYCEVRHAGRCGGLKDE